MKSSKAEWIAWNIVVCGFWGLVLYVIPDTWPMLLLVLPLQAAINFILYKMFTRDRLMILMTFAGIAAAWDWILVLRYHSVLIAILGLLPLSRVLWVLWSERAVLFAKEEN